MMVKIIDDRLLEKIKEKVNERKANNLAFNGNSVNLFRRINMSGIEIIY